jgi:hypothetical protein
MRLVLKLGSIASRTIFNDCCPQQLTGAPGTAACVTRGGCTTKHTAAIEAKLRERPVLQGTRNWTPGGAALREAAGATRLILSGRFVEAQPRRHLSAVGRLLTDWPVLPVAIPSGLSRTALRGRQNTSGLIQRLCMNIPAPVRD